MTAGQQRPRCCSPSLPHIPQPPTQQPDHACGQFDANDSRRFSCPLRVSPHLLRALSHLAPAREQPATAAARTGGRACTHAPPLAPCFLSPAVPPCVLLVSDVDCLRVRLCRFSAQLLPVPILRALPCMAPHPFPPSRCLLQQICFLATIFLMTQRDFCCTVTRFCPPSLPDRTAPRPPCALLLLSDSCRRRRRRSAGGLLCGAPDTICCCSHCPS